MKMVISRPCLRQRFGERRQLVGAAFRMKVAALLAAGSDFDAVEAGVRDAGGQLVVAVRAEILGEGAVFVAPLGGFGGPRGTGQGRDRRGGKRPQGELATIDQWTGWRHSPSFLEVRTRNQTRAIGRSCDKIHETAFYTSRCRRCPLRIFNRPKKRRAAYFLLRVAAARGKIRECPPMKSPPSPIRPGSGCCCLPP